LSKEAKAEWRRQVKALIALNLVSKIDRAALALFCEAWAEFVVTVETLSRSSLLIKNNLTGGLERNPLLFVRDRAAERILRLSDRFGFSPAARARLRVVEGEQHAQNSKEKFFKSSAKSG
jgi:P27 family predicted phage terminase small subunit